MKPKYRPLDYEDPDAELGPSEAIIQAAQILDVTMDLALKSGNTDIMLNAAAMWMKIGEMLSHGEELIEASAPPSPVGYYVMSGDEIEEELLDE